jgi:hypothetical protein
MWHRLWTLIKSPVWTAAWRAVAHTEFNDAIQAAAEREDMITYCPRCGLRPQGDRRMDEAREMATTELVTQGILPRRSDLDYALAWHAWKVQK